MNRLRVILAIGAALALASACSSSPDGSKSPSGFGLVHPGYLTIAETGSYPPDIVVNSDATLGGIEGILFSNFAKDHGLKIKLYQTTFASMILAVQAHKADVGTYVYYTADRAKHIYYTVPFYTDYTAMITKKGAAYSGPGSMTGKSIGSIVGFAWDPDLQKAFSSHLKLFPSQATVGTALLNGQIDGYVGSLSAAFSPPLSPGTATPHILSGGDFGVPSTVWNNTNYNFTACNNKALAKALDAETAKLYADGTWKAQLQALSLAPGTATKLAVPAQKC